MTLTMRHDGGTDLKEQTWLNCRMPKMLRYALKGSKDPVARYRAVWFTVAFSISFTITAIGAGYAFAGEHATAAPEIFKYVAILPGGIRTHGWILFLLGLGSFWSVSSLAQVYKRFSYLVCRVTAIGILFYSSFIAIGLGAGFVFGGAHYAATIWWYLMVAVLSTARVALPPPFRGQPPMDRSSRVTRS